MDQLIEESEKKVRQLFELGGRPELMYHNLQHTLEVVEAVKQMCVYYKIQEEDYAAAVIAAWWHDTGYLTGGAVNHETRSAEQATVFLEACHAPEEIIKKVEGCIMATRMPQQPNGLLEEIICDADLFHLGSNYFAEKTKALRKEIEKISGQSVKGSNWRDASIRLMESHQYHTAYARERLEEGKEANLNNLRSKQEEKQQKAQPEKESRDSGPAVEAESDEHHDAGHEKVKAVLPKRGIETMFRLTSKNHIDISGMADNKANIMISVNSIIISVVLSVLFRRLEDLPHLVIPTLILLGVNVSTIIFAVKATRPNVTRGVFTREDILQKKVNLLFFGNFHKMSLPEFDWAMKEMMNDSNYLYSSLIKDIYFLGVVLGKKYKWLRISYNIFMYGMIATVVAFAIGGWLGSKAAA